VAKRQREIDGRKNLNRDYHDYPGLPGLIMIRGWVYHGNYLIMAICGSDNLLRATARIPLHI